MATQLKLGVFRRLDNRFEGLPDDSPRALELHNRRRAALHHVFDAERSIVVYDWGATDDAEPHEYVELTIGAVASAAFTYAIVPGVRFVAEKLAEKLVDETTSQFVQWLTARLRPRQVAKEILDFHISLPDGTHIRF